MNNDLYQTTNNCVIEGTLSEVNLEDYTLKRSNSSGQMEEVDALRGTIVVKTEEKVDDEILTIEVPVHVFTTKTTKKNKANPSYSSMLAVKDEYVSLAVAATDTEEKLEPTCVRVTGSDVRMNEYYTADGSTLVSYPRIHGSFVNKVKEKDTLPKAVWELTLYIADMGYKTDPKTEEVTNEFEIKGISVSYNGDVSVITIMTENPKIAEGIENNYSIGDTVPFSGKIVFTTKTETIVEEVEIGDPIVKERTRTVSKLVITGAKAALDEGLSEEAVSAGLAKRKAKLEEKRDSLNKAKPGETKAPAPNKPLLGF